MSDACWNFSGRYCPTGAACHYPMHCGLTEMVAFPPDEPVNPDRPLRDIAREIIAKWPKPFYAAVPYLQAMARMDKITDDFGHDTGKSIVTYFLSNAKGWRGPDARNIKYELKRMMKGT